MMKTLLFAEFDVMGGTRTYLKRIVEYLSQFSSIVLVARERLLDFDIVAFLRQKGVHVVRWKERRIASKILTVALGERAFDALTRRVGWIFPSAGLPSVASTIGEYWFVKKLVRRHAPDLLFVSQGGGRRYFSVLAIDRPTVFVTHSLMIENPIGGFATRFLRKRISVEGAAAKRIVCVSECSLRNLRGHLRSLPLDGNYRRVYNHGGSAKIELRHERGKDLTVLTLGHVTGYKRPDFWIRVSKELVNRIEGIQFLWGGDGNLLEKCRRATRNQKNIKFLGLLSDVDSYYQRADIYFHPSEIENHPISVVESMKWSVPCAANLADDARN